MSLMLLGERGKKKKGKEKGAGVLSTKSGKCAEITWRRMMPKRRVPDGGGEKKEKKKGDTVSIP